MKQATFDTQEHSTNEREGRRQVGGFLIIMGGIFLLGVSEVSILGQSPSVLMALIPLYWIGVAAHRRYKEEGRLSGRVFSILVFGTLPFVYVGASILDLGMGSIWPVGLIAAGVSYILFNSGK